MLPLNISPACILTAYEAAPWKASTMDQDLATYGNRTHLIFVGNEAINQ